MKYLIFINQETLVLHGCQLTLFWLMLPFYIPGKHDKTKGFVVFSGALKSKQWSEKD